MLLLLHFMSLPTVTDVAVWMSLHSWTDPKSKTETDLTGKIDDKCVNSRINTFEI